MAITKSFFTTMLNRRHLRVKVLQALYAYHQSDNKDIKQHEKNLLQSVDKVYEMYIWMLSLISEVVQLCRKSMLRNGKHKHLPTAEDLNPQSQNTRQQVYCYH